MTTAAARRHGLLATAGGLVLAACGGESPTPPPNPPAIAAAAVAAGTQNVLSARVQATVLRADSVAVRYGPAGGARDSVTPAVAIAADSVDLALPVLGLQPGTAYESQVIAWAGEEVGTGEVLPFTTGALPPDLPAFTAGGPSPLPGYVAFALGTWALIIDNTGRVVWYRALPGGSTLNFQPQPTGHYFTSPVTAPPGEPRPWLEFDVMGEAVRTLGCADGLRSRFHDILAEPDGGYWMLCDETRVMDLTAIGGQSAAAVTATELQHVGADGTLQFRWNAFDHFALTDLDPAFRGDASVNFTHGNAFDFDGRGRVLLSFRSLSEITAVDLATGAVAWRMGGRANQFTFDAPGVPFARQHGLRIDPAGRLHLLDNLGQPNGSRAETYALGGSATAQLAQAAAGSPSVTALLGGAVQLLPDGHVLVAYGNGNRVQEYDASGAVAWEIRGDPGYIYRATRIASLYAPGRDLVR